MRLLRKLWADDCGAVIAAEYLFLATVLVIGTIVGLTSVRDALNAEMVEMGNAILALSQGYAISGSSGGSGSVDGSQSIDTPGTLPNATQTPPFIPSVIDSQVGN